MKKRLFSVLLTLCLVLGILPLQAFADNEGKDAKSAEPTVSVSGTAEAGKQLSADLSKLSDKEKAVIQWQKKAKGDSDSKAKNVGDGKTTYTLKQEDAGSVFRISVKENKDSDKSIVSGWTKEVTGSKDSEKDKKNEKETEKSTEETKSSESSKETGDTKETAETKETQTEKAPEGSKETEKGKETEKPRETEKAKEPEKGKETEPAKETEAKKEPQDTQSPKDTSKETDNKQAKDTGSVTLSPQILELNYVAGYAGKSEDITLKNETAAEIEIAEITPSDIFTGCANLKVGDKIAAGGSVAFKVNVTDGKAVGDYTGTLVIKDTKGTAYTLTAKLHVAEAAYTVAVTPASKDFGILTTGYAAPEAQKFEVKNTGNSSVSLTNPTAKNFVVSGLSKTKLEAGETAEFTVQPKAGLTAGTYQEKITVATDHSTSAEITANFAVKDAANYAIGVSPAQYDFGALTIGYKQPEAKTVEIVNLGNAALKLTQPTAVNFNVGALSVAELAPGAKATFTVQPKAGLEKGIYEDTIKVTTDQASASSEVKVLFTVAGNKLISIVKPSEITAKNGRAKLASSLGLPEKVKIKTTDGEKKAKVTWDVGSTDYSKYTLTKQRFTVKGKVTLPDGVSNPDGVSLVTSIKVTVKAYDPEVPSKSENKITGIEEGKYYNANTNLTFKAVGGGMDNSSPKKGDVRYEPASWIIDRTTSFSGGSYEGTFKILNNGTYTLKVTFNRQVYNGSRWEADQTTDTKSVNFHIVNGTAQKGNNGNTKTAVKTGDDSPIAMLIIICAVCVICIGGVLISKNRKRRSQKE